MPACAFIEQRLRPVVRPLGFRTAEFAWSRYAQWLAGARGIELAERRAAARPFLPGAFS
jgi:phosphatidylethanolamine/phosphatidyl-N-methylethanolamine N-methyltransferase